MTSFSSERPSEFELIAQLFAPLARAPGAFGLTDDAAVIAPPPGHELVVTADMIVAGVHFLPDDPAASIAKKALRVNLSDLAAKGAEPVGYLMALSLPKAIDRDWLVAFARGLDEDQKTYGISLLGGDTTATPGPLAISITALGALPAGTMIRRKGARPGDLVFVSGTIGDGGAGLDLLRTPRAGVTHAVREFLVHRYREPQPRVALGRAMRGLASAGLDVSDGLLADLGHIAEVSGVRVVIEAAHIPLSASWLSLHGRNDDMAMAAATGGDDYELAFTIAPSRVAAMLAGLKAAETPVTEIGRVEAGQGVVLLGAEGGVLTPARKGYTHF